MKNKKRPTELLLFLFWALVIGILIVLKVIFF